MKLNKKYRTLLRNYARSVIREEELLTLNEQYDYCLRKLHIIATNLLIFMDSKHKKRARTFTPITLVAIESEKVRMKKSQS